MKNKIIIINCSHICLVNLDLMYWQSTEIPRSGIAPPAHWDLLLVVIYLSKPIQTQLGCTNILKRPHWMLDIEGHTHKKSKLRKKPRHYRLMWERLKEYPIPFPSFCKIKTRSWTDGHNLQKNRVPGQEVRQNVTTMQMQPFALEISGELNFLRSFKRDEKISKGLKWPTKVVSWPLQASRRPLKQVVHSVQVMMKQIKWGNEERQLTDDLN